MKQGNLIRPISRPRLPGAQFTRPLLTILCLSARKDVYEPTINNLAAGISALSPNPRHNIAPVTDTSQWTVHCNNEPLLFTGASQREEDSDGGANVNCGLIVGG